MAGRFTIEAIFKGVDKITAPVRRMSKTVTKFSTNAVRSIKAVNNQINKMGRGFKSMGKTALVGLGIIGGGLALIMREFSKVENAEASFIPILGSLEKADELVKKLIKTAATTPFQFEGLADSAQVLIAMGAAGEDNVIPMLRMLGDLAGGSAEKLQRMAVNFAEISANGKAMTRDLRQFTTAGVPLIRELARMLGKTTAEIQDMASKGTITFELVQQGLKNMTGEGGKFFNAMDIASKTFSGRLSTMRDNISIVAAAIGKELAPEMKGLVVEITELAQAALKWVKANKELIGEQFRSMVKGVRGFFIFLKDNGPLLFTIAKWTLGFVVAIKALMFAIASFTPIMLVFNAVMKATLFLVALNPIVLIIAAIIVAIGLLILNWKKVIKFFSDFLAVMRTDFPVAFVVVFGAMELFIDQIKFAIDLTMTLFNAVRRVLGLGKEADEQKAAMTLAGALNPSANIAANLSEEEKSRLTDSERALFGIPPKSESSAAATITIRDETGRAEITKSTTIGEDASINLWASGAF